MENWNSIACFIEGGGFNAQAIIDGTLSFINTRFLQSSEKVRLCAGQSQGAIVSCMLCSCLEEHRGCNRSDEDLRSKIGDAVARISKVYAEKLGDGALGLATLAAQSYLNGGFFGNAERMADTFGNIIDAKSVVTSKVAFLCTAFAPTKRVIVAFANRAFLGMSNNPAQMLQDAVGLVNVRVRVKELHSASEVWEAIYASCWNSLLGDPPMFEGHLAYDGGFFVPIYRIAALLGFGTMRILTRQPLEWETTGILKCSCQDKIVPIALALAKSRTFALFADALLLAAQFADSVHSSPVREQVSYRLILEGMACSSRLTCEVYCPDAISLANYPIPFSNILANTFFLASQQFLSLIDVFKNQASRQEGCPTVVFSNVGATRRQLAPVYQKMLTKENVNENGQPSLSENSMTAHQVNRKTWQEVTRRRKYC